jgi:hypothetical protein
MAVMSHPQWSKKIEGYWLTMHILYSAPHSFIFGIFTTISKIGMLASRQLLSDMTTIWILVEVPPMLDKGFQYIHFT